MVTKLAAILAELKAAAACLGQCEPHWLKQGVSPDFHTVEVGQTGPRILLLHGLMGAVSNWESLLPLLGEFSQTIALEFPILTGHRSEVKVPALVTFSELFIRTRAIEPVTICGNSMGGHVALRICLAAPELVDCLILSGSSGLYEHSVDSLPVRPDANYVRTHMRRVFAQEKFVTEDRVNEVVDILSDKAKILNLIHAARSAKKDNLLRELNKIAVPTLLLWGEDDAVTTMDVAQAFHKHIPKSKLVTIKNCGHAPMIEHPEWFADEVRKFLKENSSAVSREPNLAVSAK